MQMAATRTFGISTRRRETAHVTIAASRCRENLDVTTQSTTNLLLISMNFAPRTEQQLLLSSYFYLFLTSLILAHGGFLKRFLKRKGSLVVSFGVICAWIDCFVDLGPGNREGSRAEQCV